MRILLCDQHSIYRRGIRDLLRSVPGLDICGEAGTAHEAVQRTASLKPELVITEITLPDQSGVMVVRHIQQAFSGVQVIVLSAADSEEVIREVLAAGVQGYVRKGDADRDLLLAIEAARHGRTFFTRSVTQRMVETYLRRAADEGIAPGRLSPRKRQVLRLAAEGRTNKQIAVELGISLKTAEIHRSSVRRKLRLESISELVRYAIRHKIIRA